MKRFTAVLLAQITLGSLLAAAAFAQLPSLAPKASEIDRDVTVALRDLYSHNETAKALGAKAKAVLVFPDIKKAAFLVGAQYGFGALRSGDKTVGYYRTGAASYGFQAGVKKFGYALFFMTDAALAYLDKSGGWAIGTGPSVVVVDQGVARSLTTTNLRSDVYAVVFDQKGLMAGIGIEGSKITKITPGD
ncbi:MAG TPA: YSC84-related protein [Candidatus Binataceae bacterium]|nr:YSC84-related protein [Candidatus Binataceae bacterium]